MRVDIREDEGQKLAGLVTAFLDGVALNGVVMADEEAGEILRWHEDSNGEYWPQMPLDLLTGSVEIKPGSLEDHGITAKPVLHPGKVVE